MHVIGSEDLQTHSWNSIKSVQSYDALCMYVCMYECMFVEPGRFHCCNIAGIRGISDAARAPSNPPPVPEEELQEFKALVHDFAQRVIAPRAAQVMGHTRIPLLNLACCRHKRPLRRGERCSPVPDSAAATFAQ